MEEASEDSTVAAVFPAVEASAAFMEEGAIGKPNEALEGSMPTGLLNPGLCADQSLKRLGRNVTSHGQKAMTIRSMTRIVM